MQGDNLTQSPSLAPSRNLAEPLTRADVTTTESNPYSSGKNAAPSPTKILEWIGVITGIFAVIGLVVGILLTQNDLKNSIDNVKSNLEGYKNDNILIKTQIENWFSKIEDKVEQVKDQTRK